MSCWYLAYHNWWWTYSSRFLTPEKRVSLSHYFRFEHLLVRSTKYPVVQTIRNTREPDQWLFFLCLNFLFILCISNDFLQLFNLIELLCRWHALQRLPVDMGHCGLFYDGVLGVMQTCTGWTLFCVSLTLVRHRSFCSLISHIW